MNIEKEISESVYIMLRVSGVLDLAVSDSLYAALDTNIRFSVANVQLALFSTLLQSINTYEYWRYYKR